MAKKNPLLYAFVLTFPKRHNPKAIAVNQTWGARFDHLVFMSTETYPSKSNQTTEDMPQMLAKVPARNSNCKVPDESGGFVESSLYFKMHVLCKNFSLGR